MLGATGYPTGHYGIGKRNPNESEDEYFKKNPHVTGMAADDNKIIINPYSSLSDKEKQAVILNEAARVHMRTGMVKPPRFALTPKQEREFAHYSPNPEDRAATVAARILSGDPSALKPTSEQMDYVDYLRAFMGVR